jgi:hypothetical protein
MPGTVAAGLGRLPTVERRAGPAEHTATESITTEGTAIEGIAIEDIAIEGIVSQKAVIGLAERTACLKVSIGLAMADFAVADFAVESIIAITAINIEGIRNSTTVTTSDTADTRHSNSDSTAAATAAYSSMATTAFKMVAESIVLSSLPFYPLFWVHLSWRLLFCRMASHLVYKLGYHPFWHPLSSPLFFLP